MNVKLKIKKLSKFVEIVSHNSYFSKNVCKYILIYNSIRHRQFFDIFEFICKLIIELQLKLKIKQFSC